MVSYIMLLNLLLFLNGFFCAVDQMKTMGNKNRTKTRTKLEIVPGAYIVEFKADFARRPNINHVKLKNNPFLMHNFFFKV